MDAYLIWIQNNVLTILVVLITVGFLYYYLLEKEKVNKLSKKYRNSIFEAQSKIFLNATQYLISGNKDLAIKEFLNAVDLNRETIDTYFALGGLFRSNGEIDKAISIHRSLIARDNISEVSRIRALKELALDFDKGGFIDKAIDTYKDILKIDRNQIDVVQALCKIFEGVSDWDEAYNYRVMLSKLSRNGQEETISNILVQKAQELFDNGDYVKCSEELEQAFRFAPSVAAKILWLKLSLKDGNMDLAKDLLIELLYEYPNYASFLFISLENFKFKSGDVKDSYKTRLDLLKKIFLDIKDDDLFSSDSVILAKIRLLKERKESLMAYDVLKKWMKHNNHITDILRIEYIKLLIELNKTNEIIHSTEDLIKNLNSELGRHYCKQCGFNSDELFWRCPQCNEWETIQFRWKI